MLRSFLKFLGPTLGIANKSGLEDGEEEETFCLLFSLKAVVEEEEEEEGSSLVVGWEDE